MLSSAASQGPDPYDTLGRFRDPALQARIATYCETGDTTPFRADLDLSSDCNYRCAHCGDLARDLLNHGGLTWPETSQLLDDFAALGVAEVSLVGGGEPTVSPYFEAVLEGLARRNISCGVTTNGSRITRGMAQTLGGTTSWVRFSIDAATDSSYERIHRPKDDVRLSDIHRNLRLLTEWMPGRVGVSFLVMRANSGEILEAAAQAKALGAAHIRYRFANHPLTGVVMPVPDLERVVVALEQAKALEGRGFRVSLGETLEDARGAGASPQPKDYERCHAQAFSVTVAGTGDVYICSKWRGEPWARLGNVREERLTSIWRGAARRHVVESVRPCRSCSHVYCHAHAHNRWLDGATNGAASQRESVHAGAGES